MSEGIGPGSIYTVKPNDNLSGIAQQAYGNSSDWNKIYEANKFIIGNDPNLIRPGQVLYIPVLNPTRQLCTVTSPQGLNIRSEPSSKGNLVHSYPRGTTLNYVEVVGGENVDGNPRWGHSEQGNYFWLGGTDRPNG